MTCLLKFIETFLWSNIWSILENMQEKYAVSREPVMEVWPGQRRQERYHQELRDGQVLPWRSQEEAGVSSRPASLPHRACERPICIFVLFLLSLFLLILFFFLFLLPLSSPSPPLFVKEFFSYNYFLELQTPTIIKGNKKDAGRKANLIVLSWIIVSDFQLAHCDFLAGKN